jgi:hypothetical protein
MFNFKANFDNSINKDKRPIWRLQPNLPQSNSVTPFRNMQRALPPSAMQSQTTTSENLENQLFNNRASLKVLVSQVAMHLAKEERDDIFKQIDSLLDIEAWVDDSNFVLVGSMKTFLRFAIAAGKIKRPSLNVTNNRNLLATWFAKDGGQASVEFYESDSVVMLVSRRIDGVPHSLAYKGKLHSLDNALKALGADSWYRETT